MPTSPDSSFGTPASLSSLSATRRSTGGHLFRHLKPYIRTYRLAIFGAAVALLIAGGTMLSIVGGLRYVIDKGFVAHDPAMLDHTLAQLLLAILVLALATFSRYSIVTWLGERIVADLRQAVYGHILKLSPVFFETTRSGDILSRLSSDTAVLQSLLGSTLSVALRNGVLFLGGITMMLLTSPRLTGLVIIGIFCVVSPIVFFGRKVRRLSKLNQERVADISAHAEETIYGIRTVQAFSHEELSRQQYSQQTEEAVRAAARHIRIRGLWVAMIIGLIFSGIAVMLWVGGHDVLTHQMTAGQLSAFVGYAALAAGALGSISESMGELHRAEGATERIFELLAEKPNITAPAVPTPFPEPVKGDIQFDHVTFSYPTRPTLLSLQDISFAIKPGERVAIVGPSGAGKTTIFQLLLRFYDPQNGVIRIDGVNLQSADPQILRRHLGIVPQDPIIFSANAWENIAYGRPEASQDEIRAAAKVAFADTFLMDMPQGYQTHLGEKGVRLSGGQKQRIAIARALLRNPAILLLDEATSALDAESEKNVQAALDQLMKDRTTLIIAHRLSTIVNADRILVFDEGKLVESGTHQSLITAGGLYARLAALQFDQAAA